MQLEYIIKLNIMNSYKNKILIFIGLLLFLSLNCKKETIQLPPTVITAPVSKITSTSANCGGTVGVLDESGIINRGVCWSTNRNPTINDNKSIDGMGSGTFISILTGLLPGTIYYIRAYGTNSAGTGYGNQITIKTLTSLPTITTIAVSQITTNSVSSGGNITNDGGVLIKARGICWSKKQNPTILNKKINAGTGEGSFEITITGLLPGTTYYLRSFATNNIGTSYGNLLTISTLAVQGFSGSFTDPRDGHIYNWITIGSQVWMTENLAYLPAINGRSSRSYELPCYYIYNYGGKDLTEAKANVNYPIYGALYNWPAALTACPEGWHLPGDEEWEQLAQYISDQKGPYVKSNDDWLEVGGHLKAEGNLRDSTGLWSIVSDNDEGTDDFGFSGLPGGYNDEMNIFSGDGWSGNWWSSTENIISKALARSLQRGGYNEFYRGSIYKGTGFSVRCIRNHN